VRGASPRLRTETLTSQRSSPFSMSQPWPGRRRVVEASDAA